MKKKDNTIPYPAPDNSGGGNSGHSNPKGKNNYVWLLLAIAVIAVLAVLILTVK